MIPRSCITCGRPVPYPFSRCELHGGKRDGWSKYKRRHPERAAFYASAYWRSRRADHLKANPLCVVCGQPANHADHITNLASGGREDGPLQSLCEDHHRSKTLAESHRGMKRAAARRKRG